MEETGETLIVMARISEEEPRELRKPVRVSAQREAKTRRGPEKGP